MNNQPIEKVTTNPDELDIVSIFHTLQGEGPHSGRPAVFIRLAGCTLNCPTCDTDYTSNRRMMSVQSICEEVIKYSTPLIIITGGEPFRQNIEALCEQLLSDRYEVQIETNGAHCPEWVVDQQHPDFSIVICPKVRAINSNWTYVHQSHIAYKYVMHVHAVNEDGLPSTVLGHGFAPARPLPTHTRSSIYLQPEDVGDLKRNLENRNACVASCMKYGYRLCLQIQKIVQLP